MSANVKVRQGTTAWFEMVGKLMCEAASRSGLDRQLNVSLVERYTDGVEWSGGFVQGIRFDIIDGKPSFRVGAQRGESAEVMVEITAAAARQLNEMYSTDPAYDTTRDELLRTGTMKVQGDVARLGGWLEALHDPIVDRTI